MVLPYYMNYDPRLTRCPKLSPTVPSLPRVLAYSQAKGRSGPIEADSLASVLPSKLKRAYSWHPISEEEGESPHLPGPT